MGALKCAILFVKGNRETALKTKEEETTLTTARGIARVKLWICKDVSIDVID